MLYIIAYVEGVGRGTPSLHGDSKGKKSKFVYMENIEKFVD